MLYLYLPVSESVCESLMTLNLHLCFGWLLLFAVVTENSPWWSRLLKGKRSNVVAWPEVVK